MNKFWQLLKVSIKDNFEIFKINTDNVKGIKKFLIPFFIMICIFYSVAYYSYMLGSQLQPLNLTYIMLSIWMLGISSLTLFEGIYKSQGLLYDAKDNDLLMSLPITKKDILAVRIVKLILFQIVYNLLFLLPAFSVYIYFTHPNLSFYLISILMLIFLPIIPTIIAALIGSLVKLFSSNFKNKKLIQTLFSIILVFILMYFSFALQTNDNAIANNALKINDVISSIYYPIKLYIRLITNYNVIDLFQLIAISIIPLIIFIYIMSIYYFKIILKSSETNVKNNKKYEAKVKTPLNALIFKEFKTFINSPVYILNTLFGLIILLVGSIAITLKPDLIINITQNEINLEALNQNIYLYYIAGLIFILCLTSITSSSISLEGKYFNILKSLPVSFKDIILAKLVNSLNIIYPFVLISDLFIIVHFKLSLINIIYILLVSIFIPILIGLVGLLINLKYPKMHFKNETEVVKQSISVVISVYLGMGIAIALISIYLYFNQYLSSNVVIISEILLIVLFDYILYKFILNKGESLFRKINI
jgi:ABC-2 type transport system permease protein